MGIPKFYRWLSERYPLINQEVKEDVNKPEFGALLARAQNMFRIGGGDTSAQCCERLPKHCFTLRVFSSVLF
jgi:hypothetical protein